MNERLRELREALKMSRAAFGEKLGVSGDVINNLERGRVDLRDPMFSLIIKTFNVNESWLRTGEGEMFLKMDVEEEIAELIKKIPNEPRGSFKRRLLATLAGLTEDQWVLLADIAEKLAEEKEDDE